MFEASFGVLKYVENEHLDFNIKETKRDKLFLKNRIGE